MLVLKAWYSNSLRLKVFYRKFCEKNREKSLKLYLLVFAEQVFKFAILATMGD